MSARAMQQTSGGTLTIGIDLGDKEQRLLRSRKGLRGNRGGRHHEHTFKFREALSEVSAQIGCARSVLPFALGEPGAGALCPRGLGCQRLQRKTDHSSNSKK